MWPSRFDAGRCCANRSKKARAQCAVAEETKATLLACRAQLEQARAQASEANAALERSHSAIAAARIEASGHEAAAADAREV